MNSQVADIMTATVVTADPSTTFKQLAELMARTRVNAVPVISPDGHVTGVVSMTDLLLKQADPASPALPHPLAGPRRRRELRKAAATVAAELMTTPAITISPTAPVTEAARLMRRHHISHLPVLDHGRLVGIVARRDLISIYDRPDTDIRHHIVHHLIPLEFVTDPNRFAVTVHDGQVTIQGKTERRSQIPQLLQSLRRIEGVVSVTGHLGYDTDDTLLESHTGPPS